MNLASLLTKEQIVPDLKSTDHWEVIVELVDHLSSQGFLPPEVCPATLEALKEREGKISTGIGSGVAIPHAFSDQIDQVVAVFGRSAEGINFESVDNNPVHFIVLFVVPKEKYHLHLKTLAAIGKLFTRCEVRQKLSDAKNREDILAVFDAQAVCA
jgi:mannitol/fructose-specific phosphotransferase system IIA component (Ntr-type)